MKEKIIEFIRKNKVSTTEVADCLGKSGALDGIYSISPGMFRAGSIHYVYGHSESNQPVHAQVSSNETINPGDVIVAEAINFNNRALFGELVTKYLVLYRGVEAIVALGKLRDANDLIKQKYPCWAQGITPVGSFNNEVADNDEIKAYVAKQREFFEGAIAVCDDAGVVVIPKEQHTESFMRKLQLIEQQEDIWFHCIDFLKWDTYETVCLKKYKEIPYFKDKEIENV